MASKIQGFFPVTTTPFSASGELMLDAFAELLEWHIRQGCDGLCVGADNGESWALETDELGRVAETAVRVSAGRVPVLCGALGTASLSARQAIKRAEVAATAGADAVLVSPQVYLMAGTRSEVVKRYQTIYETVRVPIVVYNAPRHFGITLDADTLEAICGVVDVVGVKESSRDFFHTTQIIHRFGKRLCVFVGPGWFIMPGIALGARGFLSTGPDLLGVDAAKIIPLARQVWTEETRQLHARVARVYHTLLELGLGTPPAPVKMALNLMGLPVGVPRAPIEPLSPESTQTLIAILREVGAPLREV